MGQVLELKQRISGDWSVVERLHLDQLVSMLPATLAQDIEFGVSDAGDPWCAVMNGEGEVVLHVARIEGRFFVHSTVEPFVADSNDLPSAIAPFVGDSFLERRHIATVTPMYGLMMPLHAYAPPGTLLEQPGADWLHHAVAEPMAPEDGTPALPDAPDAWTAQVIPFNAQPDAPQLAPVMDDAAVLFPIQESDWPAAVSGELLDFSAPSRMDAVAQVQVENVSFEPFVLPTPAEPILAQSAETSEQSETPQTTGIAGPGGNAAVGGNVVSVEFGQGGAGFNAAHTGALEGLARAAAGEELSIGHLDPIVIGWSDQTPGLMGVAPAAEAF